MISCQESNLNQNKSSLKLQSKKTIVYFINVNNVDTTNGKQCSKEKKTLNVEKREIHNIRPQTLTSPIQFFHFLFIVIYRGTTNLQYGKNPQR